MTDKPKRITHAADLDFTWIGKRVGIKGETANAHYIVRGVTSNGTAYMESVGYHYIVTHSIDDLEEVK